MPEPFDGDPYATLHVPRNATASEIRRAFHRLAKQHHPDLDGSAGAVAEMARINAAYEILSDPPRRIAWDEAHRTGMPRPVVSTAPRSAGAPARTGRPAGGPAAARGARACHGDRHQARSQGRSRAIGRRGGLDGRIRSAPDPRRLRPVPLRARDRAVPLRACDRAPQRAHDWAPPLRARERAVLHPRHR